MNLPALILMFKSRIFCTMNGSIEVRRIGDVGGR